MKFSICGLGCKVNTYEAESIASSLEKRGYERVAFEEPADVSLIFTCAVTNTAAHRTVQIGISMLYDIDAEALGLMMAGVVIVGPGVQFEDPTTTLTR